MAFFSRSNPVLLATPKAARWVRLDSPTVGPVALNAKENRRVVKVIRWCFELLLEWLAPGVEVADSAPPRDSSG